MEIISEKSLEEQAKELENSAKKQIAAKNLDRAIEYYENALNIYNKMGWEGQIHILRKQIQKLESLRSLFTLNKDDKIKENKQKFEIEKEADGLVNRGKHAVFEKKFQSAIEFYEVAVSLYKEIGFNFMVLKLNEKINNLKEKIGESLTKSDELKIEQQISNKNVAVENNEQTLQENEKLKQHEAQRLTEFEKERQRNLEIEEKRKKKMQEMTNQQKNKGGSKLEDWFVPEIANMGGKTPKPKTNEKLTKLQKLNKEKEQQEKLLHDAEKFLDDAKKHADHKDFVNARKLYKAAAEKFTQLGWIKQAITIRKEIDVLTEKENERIERKRLEEELKKQNEQEIEEIILKDQEKKDRLKQLEEEKAKILDPNEQRKIDMANMIISKGKTAEKKGKLEEAIKRYEVAIELFEEIQYKDDELKNLKNLIKKLKS